MSPMMKLKYFNYCEGSSPMGITPNKKLEIQDIQQRLRSSLRKLNEQQDEPVKIRLADYPSLTVKELTDEIENSGHSVIDIDNTYLTLN